MHKEYHYGSVFADLIKDYIASRREAGFMYDNPACGLLEHCDVRYSSRNSCVFEKNSSSNLLSFIRHLRDHSW